MKPRKLMQHGASSLTVAIPRTWVVQHHLEKGDAVFVAHEADALIITPVERKRRDTVVLNADGLDRTSLLLACQSLYRYGYDKIEITFTKPLTTHYRTGKDVAVAEVVHQIVNRMIGAEIIEQSKNRLLISSLALESSEDFRAVLRRTFRLVQDLSQTLYDGVATGDTIAIASIEAQHDSINKFVNYTLRLLNKEGYPDVRKTSFYFHIIATIDKIVDIFKYIARDSPGKLSPSTLAICARIHRSIELYVTLFYAYDTKTIALLSENRDATKNAINALLPKLDARTATLLTRLQQVQELLMDLTDFRFALEQ